VTHFMTRLVRPRLDGLKASAGEAREHRLGRRERIVAV